ncbi:MAG TPA: hypothetical protein VF185_03670 [Patescibacteria group bacterium]
MSDKERKASEIININKYDSLFGVGGKPANQEAIDIVLGENQTESQSTTPEAKPTPTEEKMPPTLTDLRLQQTPKFGFSKITTEVSVGETFAKSSEGKKKKKKGYFSH